MHSGRARHARVNLIHFDALGSGEEWEGVDVGGEEWEGVGVGGEEWDVSE